MSSPTSVADSTGSRLGSNWPQLVCGLWGWALLRSGLNQRSELDDHTQRGDDERHRTLHNLVEWSYDLLSAGERETFEQLAVFAGGFDLAAAEAVCSVQDGSGSILGSPLGSRRQVDDRVDRPVATVATECSNRSANSGTDFSANMSRVDATEDRHLDWFIALAEAGEAGLDGTDEPMWSDDLDREFDNFRVAHVTAVGRNDPARALAIVALLSEFATRRVQYEITTWAEASLELPNIAGESESGNDDRSRCVWSVRSRRYG